ncbi:unnamed protein product, partial [Adineta ricciae]
MARSTFINDSASTALENQIVDILGNMSILCDDPCIETFDTENVALPDLQFFITLNATLNSTERAELAKRLFNRNAAYNESYTLTLIQIIVDTATRIPENYTYEGQWTTVAPETSTLFIIEESTSATRSVSGTIVDDTTSALPTLVETMTENTVIMDVTGSLTTDLPMANATLATGSDTYITSSASLLPDNTSTTTTDKIIVNTDSTLSTIETTGTGATTLLIEETPTHLTTNQSEIAELTTPMPASISLFPDDATGTTDANTDVTVVPTTTSQSDLTAHYTSETQPPMDVTNETVFTVVPTYFSTVSLSAATLPMTMISRDTNIVTSVMSTTTVTDASFTHEITDISSSPHIFTESVTSATENNLSETTMGTIGTTQALKVTSDSNSINTTATSSSEDTTINGTSPTSVTETSVSSDTTAYHVNFSTSYTIHATENLTPIISPTTALPPSISTPKENTTIFSTITSFSPLTTVSANVTVSSNTTVQNVTTTTTSQTTAAFTTPIPTTTTTTISQQCTWTNWVPLTNCTPSCGSAQRREIRSCIDFSTGLSCHSQLCGGGNATRNIACTTSPPCPTLPIIPQPSIRDPQVRITPYLLPDPMYFFEQTYQRIW